MKIGVLLSGCGVNDGSEIHEATLTLLHILKNGGTPVCIAPNMPQKNVVNHLTGEEVINETRNTLVEAARISRGDIKDLAEITEDDLDALIIPGGFGAAKNISNFALIDDKTQTIVEPQTARLIQSMHMAAKPMGFMCISPASIAAPALQGRMIQLTTGQDEGTILAINALENIGIMCNVDEIIIDEKNRIASTPAYMLGKNIAEIELGIAKLVSWVYTTAQSAKAA